MSTLAESDKAAPNRMKPLDRRLFFCLAAIMLSTSGLAAAPLTKAADVLALSAEEALKGQPVQVRGVVTAAEQTWGGRFFIQDETSGVFVENLSTNHPDVGDVIELNGISHPGAFAPIITRPKWKRIGTGPLPEPRSVPIEQIMSGAEDGQRVEIIGIVRAVAPGTTHFDLEIAAGGYRLHAFPRRRADVVPQSLIGARVRIKGTAAASFNAALRHLVSVVLFVPLPTDFIIEQPETSDPLKEPLLPLNAVAQYRKAFLPGQRVRVKGVVTLNRPGQDMFLQDNTGGLHVKSRQPQSFVAGDVVEAIGFPDFEHNLPVLEDAVFRKTDEPRALTAPRLVSMQEIQAGLHHSSLVKLDGKLLDRIVQHRDQRANTISSPLTSAMLLLQHDNLRFSAEVESVQNTAAIANIPIGSTLEVAGICFTELGANNKLKSLQILLPDSESVRVLTKPSWWTPHRLLIGLTTALAVLAAAVSWIVMVSRRNSVLNQLIREKEKAQSELQLAHDQLEERVKERTAQLKFQITARKESEVQFKATLAERTRLAQEIHDTLEQTLTGIALQLDMTSKLFRAQPDNANHHLDLASDLLAQSQSEVRRSVWNLRSRALEEFDLRGAMVSSGKQLTDGTNIQFEVTARGRVRPLPETIEENLLRIAQEALTNIIKHSQATTATIELDYGPRNVAMQIRDNGRGFDFCNSVGPREGHFGLLGISERAKQMGTEAVFDSNPGQGTTLSVQVAIDQEIPESAEFQSHERNGT